MCGRWDWPDFLVSFNVSSYTVSASVSVDFTVQMINENQSSWYDFLNVLVLFRNTMEKYKLLIKNCIIKYKWILNVFYSLKINLFFFIIILQWIAGMDRMENQSYTMATPWLPKSSLKMLSRPSTNMHSSKPSKRHQLYQILTDSEGYYTVDISRLRYKQLISVISQTSDFFQAKRWE